MTCIANQCNGVVLANPRRDRVTVVDLPVQTFFCLVHRRRNLRVTSLHDLADLVHISLMEPGLVWVQLTGIFPVEDPVEFFPIAQCILD